MRNFKRWGAIILAIAVVGCLGYFSKDRLLKATEGDAGTQQEQQAESSASVEVAVPAKAEPETKAAPEPETKEEPVAEAPVEEAPVKETPAEEKPVEEAPVEEAVDVSAVELEKAAFDPNAVEVNVIMLTDPDTIYLGDPVEFKADLAGFEPDTYSIQWQVKIGSAWENIPGEVKENCRLVMTEELCNAELRVMVSSK